MKIRQLTILLLIVLILPLFLSSSPVIKKASAQTLSDLFFGVDVGYENVTETKQLIDEVSSYTNFFIIGCTGHYNITRLTEISNYVCAANMSFVVYTDDPRYPTQAWYAMAQTQYGDRFLGIYVLDEPGGHQLDDTTSGYYLNFWSANDYADATNQFVNNVSPVLTAFSSRSGSMPLFTSDYALYWFDYKAGYSTVFAEFGWNYSQTLNVALCRGAATLQNKDWGVMLTWTYTTPPYLESGKDLLKDMIWAYQSGAKYIVIFDSNGDWTQDILGQDQLDAMQMFWEYAQSNPRANVPPSLRTAYVLPHDYGYGFRSPNDKVWGIWEANDNPYAYDLSISVKIMLDNYGSNLDIVYEDGIQAGTTGGYGHVIYWNDPNAVAQQWGDYPPHIVTASPTPNPDPTVTSTPTPSPSPSTTPSLTVSPSSTPTQSASPTQSPSFTADPEVSTFPINGVYIAFALVCVFGASLVAYVAKRRKR